MSDPGACGRPPMQLSRRPPSLRCDPRALLPAATATVNGERAVLAAAVGQRYDMVCYPARLDLPALRAPRCHVTACKREAMLGEEGSDGSGATLALD